MSLNQLEIQQNNQICLEKSFIQNKTRESSIKDD